MSTNINGTPSQQSYPMPAKSNREKDKAREREIVRQHQYVNFSVLIMTVTNVASGN